LGVPAHAPHERYLGLPIMVGKSKTRTFNDLKDRVAKKLVGWKEKTLSSFGREVLIKAVAQAIPSYTMSCFKLSKQWCNELQTLCGKYWWGQQRSERKIH
jgi:hypothetical protein